MKDSIQVHRHDSDLGRWIHAEWRPASLAGVVERFWYFEGTLAHPRERVFPDGRPEIVVHFGCTYGRVEGERVDRFAPACLSGLSLKPETIEAPEGGCAALGIRLHAAGAFALLGRPLHDITGVTVDLADLLAGAANELAERCAAVEGAEARLRAAACWVAARVAGAPGADPAVAWAAGQIERQGGSVSIADLHDRTGWSKSRFTTVFREQIGVTPKVLARLVRFRNAIALVRHASLPLAEVAHRAGYYDQPHFNAEFHAFAGLTPGAYRAALRYPASVNLAEARP